MPTPKIDKTKAAVWCYNTWKVWDVNKAIKNMREGINCSEGSEQNRYSNILCDLLDIKEYSINDMKKAGFRFFKFGDIFVPVASDQEETLMKKTDTVVFEKEPKVR